MIKMKDECMVLDMCCGPRMMWFDKQDDRAVFLDRRRERHAMNRPKRGTVEWTETDPDILCDFTDMPFDNDTFEHVVFDPPHFERSGKIGFLAMKYGWLDGDWRKMLSAGFEEGFRVLKPGGTLVFKWTATENPVSEILKLTPMKPLYGHKSGKQQQTHWIAFIKKRVSSPPAIYSIDFSNKPTIIQPMSIENNLKELTAAVKELAENVKENTTAAKCCETPAPVKKKAPAKKKTAPKKEEAPAPEPEVKEETPAPDPEPEVKEETPAETPEPEAPAEDFDRAAVLLKITEHVKSVFIDEVRDTATDQESFATLRKSYNVERAGDVEDDKLEQFYTDTVALFS